MREEEKKKGNNPNGLFKSTKAEPQ
uniref:Uncharacterized protein n=1 Tax=Lepeophtheirus salmonis TaxID=72036 RepID=A0A0K2ULB0_LEPSM